MTHKDIEKIVKKAFRDVDKYIEKDMQRMPKELLDCGSNTQECLLQEESACYKHLKLYLVQASGKSDALNEEVKE